MNPAAFLCVLILATFSGGALAQMKATTGDGRQVILNEDFTWRYAEDGGEATDAPVPDGFVTLAIERRFGEASSCTYGIRARNELPYMVESLVPQFSVYTAKGVLVDTVYKSLTLIKPTQSRYIEVQFNRLSCDEIGQLKVHGADRCTMGSMDKYTWEKGQCLAHIDVRASQLVEFSK